MDNYEIYEEIEENQENQEIDDINVDSEEKDNEEKNDFLNLFRKLKDTELSIKENSLYNQIYSETKQINSYLMKLINEFHQIFQSNLFDFEDALNYLEIKSVPNNCVCTKLIDIIPGWRCKDCSKYESSMYCNDCFQNSKYLHRHHKVYFLNYVTGMCNCGDPNIVKTFCPDHTGPYTSQNLIDEYISKVFPNEILNKLYLFFDELFLNFSKYFILTEKCELFYCEIFNEKFDSITQENQKIINEKNDIILLKKNFCIVFQNFINFLRLISQKNLAIFHIIAKYLLKNHLENQQIEDNYLTTHRCINIIKDNINIMFEDGTRHVCRCPFLRLLLSNWREEIKSKENENEEFILLFTNNLFLRKFFCIIIFFIYKNICLNNNEDILYNKYEFFMDDNIELIGKKSVLIEENYEFLYEYFKNHIKSPKLKDKNGYLREKEVKKVEHIVFYFVYDLPYYSKPKIKKLITEKTSIIKRIIDCFCLIHNELEYISIFPHPQFQIKSENKNLLYLEFTLIQFVERINILIDWDRLDKAREIFNYIINKILNQEKQGIKKLQEDEYSIFLSLYRCFGLLINSYCFNYAMKYKSTLIGAIQFFKNIFFSSKNDAELLVNKILYDYFRFFGFLAGCNNNYFNYYEDINIESMLYLSGENTTQKIDFTLLKYLFAMTDKRIDLNMYLKVSNIENVYSSFNKVFFSKIDGEEKNTKYNYYSNNNDDKNHDENDCIMQWRSLLEMLIILIKDDSNPYLSLMRSYGGIISSETKRELYNNIRKNEYVMKDLENILKEIIILRILAKGNLINLKQLKKNIDIYLLNIFEENQVDKIINELTINKMNGETKIFYLKDSSLNYLDMNYYISSYDKSKAQRYILEFKKDVISLYNNYYFNPSKLTFEFFKKTYEKIFLNENNLEFIIKIVERLLICKKTDIGDFNLKSIKNTFLPIILNYLSIFSMINTKSFIEFKIENRKRINYLSNIFNTYISNNKSNEIVETDLQKYIKEIINQLNNFEIIYNDIKSDLSKLNNYDYNTKYVEQLKKSINDNNSKNSLNSKIKNDSNKLINKEDNSKKMKERLKKNMKMKSDNFLIRMKSNKEIMEEINNVNKKVENENEIICFYCRRQIKMNSFKVSYGKPGLLINDYLYINSKKSTVRKELLEISKDKNVNNSLYSFYNKLLDYNNNTDDSKGRIISCGHYFHSECFKQGCAQNDIKEFNCPVCLKRQNILIPPLNNFRDKYNIFKSENMYELFDVKIKDKKMDIIEEDNIFKEIIFNFLIEINLLKKDKIKDNYIEYELFLGDIFMNYKGYFNFFENVFYIDGTTFHKHQQIDTMQNIILSLRYLTKIKYLNKIEIIKYIKKELLSLSKGSDINEDNIIIRYKDFHYVNKFEKILLSLSILFDYDDQKETFKYIIYIFLPYMAFGLYLRFLIINNYNLNNINTENFKNYFKNNNNQMINYFSMFLQKFIFIKILTDFNNKNEELKNIFNEFTIEELFTLLNMDNIYKILINDTKREINFIEIFEYLPKSFNSNDIIFRLLKNNFNYNKIFDLLISIIKKSHLSEESLTKELIINFTPIIFDFIHLDNNIFDLIEKNIKKKCCVCFKNTNTYYICLICGNKICFTTICNKYCEHVEKCCKDSSVFLNMKNMKEFICKSYDYSKNLTSLYVNENGVGPIDNKIGNEYKLSQEILKCTIKNYVCNDFNFDQIN